MNESNLSKAIALSVGVLAMVFSISLIVLAWTEPPYGGTCTNPPCPPGGNVPSPLRSESTDLNLAGATWSERNVININEIVGYNDLILRGKPANGAPIYLEGTSVIINNDTGTGNVGIGTTSPSKKLTVEGGSIRPAVGNSGDAGIYFPTNPGGGSGDEAFIRYYVESGETTRLRIGINNDADDRLSLYQMGDDRLTIYNGNVGIGTTAPGAKLDVAGWVKSKTGYLDRNMLDTTIWTTNVGSGTGGVGGFGQNGATAENGRIWSTDPFGRPSLIWESINDAGSDADGGWNYGSIPIDNNKAYRLTVWIKKVGTTSGTVYLGCDGGNTLNLDNTANTNPYFFSFASSNLTSDRWYLLVGYIHANNDTSTTSYSAVYDGVTGKKVLTGRDYKNRGTTNYQVHRTYNYYDTIAGSIQYFWGPGFEEIDGHEPSIEALLGIPQGATNEVVSYFGGSVGIGTTGPGYKLDVQGGQINASGGLCIAGTCKTTWSQTGIQGGGTLNYLAKFTDTGTIGNSQIFDNGTNVGIGTTGPGQKLTVSAPSGTRVASFDDGVGPCCADYYTVSINEGYGVNQPTLQFHDSGVAEGQIILQGDIGGGQRGFRFQSVQTSMGGRFTGNLLVDGNVGIGTASPGYKLDVVSGGATTARFGTVSTDKVIIGGGAGKLDVGTVDPIFEINGKKYATYMADFAGGTRVETSGTIQLTTNNLQLTTDNLQPKKVIDFDNLEEGSNLWLFWQASNKNINDVAVLLTPSFDGKAWYQKNGNTLTIYGEGTGEVSYRLSAPRVDYKKWSNLADNQSLVGINVSDY